MGIKGIYMYGHFIESQMKNNRKEDNKQYIKVIRLFCRSSTAS